jgi:hypothetical protein
MTTGPRWDSRREKLRELLQEGPEARRVLADSWLSSSAWASGPAFEWQLEVGRALLDWPDVDRDAVRARLDELVAQRRT